MFVKIKQNLYANVAKGALNTFSV